MPELLKLSEQQAADIRARIKSLDFKSVEKIRKAKDANGTFDVIISTEDTDRAGEIVKQNGWELTNYKNNPIVLWGHDYYSLPIGVCTETYLTEKDGVPALGARGVFLSADINPFAQQVRKLYEFGIKQGAGVGCTTSVGFIPKEFDENARNTITKAELLEFSFVPIPANQGVGPARGRALTFEEARALGLDMVGMKQKGIHFAETLGYIPSNVSDKKAAPNTAWSKPALKDFTDKQWEDLSLAEKKHIAGHYAYAKSESLDSFEDLKLPHHRASDGAVAWNGVKAAMGALMGARGGVDVDGDKEAVYKHLAAHYKEFEKEPPELKTLKEAQPGDTCQMDDGAPGVLTTDPKDPDGPLVCLPQDQDKSAGQEHASQKALLKSINDEHERHGSEVEKAFDEFEKALPEPDGEDDEKKKAESEIRDCIKELRTSIADEHTMHRAKSVACFRGFDPKEDKAFDKNPHLKALREAHDEYETKCGKSLDDFEEKCAKSVEGGDTDEHVGWIIGKMEDAQRVHKKAVTKIAKAMCKAAFGEEDQADEKTLEILKEYLAPHIDAQLLPAVAAKIGAKLSAETKKKLGEAHEHLKAATAVVEALHGGLGDSEGEESRSDDDGKKSSAKAPENKRSRPAGDASAKAELDAHMLARDVLRGVTTAASTALERLKNETRNRK